MAISVGEIPVVDVPKAGGVADKDADPRLGVDLDGLNCLCRLGCGYLVICPFRFMNAQMLGEGDDAVESMDGAAGKTGESVRVGGDAEMGEGESDFGAPGVARATPEGGFAAEGGLERLSTLGFGLESILAAFFILAIREKLHGGGVVGMGVGVETKAVGTVGIQHVIATSLEQCAALLAGDAEGAPQAEVGEELREFERGIIGQRVHGVFDVHEDGDSFHEMESSRPFGFLGSRFAARRLLSMDCWRREMPGTG